MTHKYSRDPFDDPITSVGQNVTCLQCPCTSPIATHS